MFFAHILIVHLHPLASCYWLSGFMNPQDSNLSFLYSSGIPNKFIRFSQFYRSRRGLTRLISRLAVFRQPGGHSAFIPPNPPRISFHHSSSCRISRRHGPAASPCPPAAGPHLDGVFVVGEREKKETSILKSFFAEFVLINVIFSSDPKPYILPLPSSD